MPLYMVIITRNKYWNQHIGSSFRILKVVEIMDYQAKDAWDIHAVPFINPYTSVEAFYFEREVDNPFKEMVEK